MASLRTELRGVLGEMGVLEPVTLGSGPKQSYSSADKERLAKVISTQQQFNRKLLLLAVGMVASLFALCFFVVLYYINRPGLVTIALGGNLFSILLTVSWIRRLWIEKGVVDVALIAVQEMSPDEGVKLASSVYFGLLEQKPDGSRRTRGQVRKPTLKRMDRSH